MVITPKQGLEKVLNTYFSGTSYKQFPPTRFIHQVDVKPLDLEIVHSYRKEYRSTEPLLSRAGAQTPWQN
jgi:hypothetical protein